MTPVDQLLDVAVVDQAGNKEDEVVNHVGISVSRSMTRSATKLKLA